MLTNGEYKDQKKCFGVSTAIFTPQAPAEKVVMFQNNDRQSSRNRPPYDMWADRKLITTPYKKM